jgi:hypothetical protein
MTLGSVYRHPERMVVEVRCPLIQQINKPTAQLSAMGLNWMLVTVSYSLKSKRSRSIAVL